MSLSNDGERSASCPTGLRESTSEVISPCEWISLADIQPPAVVVVPAIAKACTVLVIPTVSVLPWRRCGAAASGAPGWAGPEGAEHASATRQKASTSAGLLPARLIRAAGPRRAGSNGATA